MLSMSELDRFTNLAFMQGDFKKVNTSPSQTALADWLWMTLTHLSSHLNFKPQLPAIAFKSGIAVHQYFQNVMEGKMKISDVEKQYKLMLDNTVFPEKEKVKGQFILKVVKQYVINHINMLVEISGKDLTDWIPEKRFHDWYDEKYMNQKLEIVTEGAIDCYNPKLKIFTEHKNRFGSAYLSKAKKNEGKKIYNYRKPSKTKSPQFTHLIAVAVYAHHLGKDYQPALLYCDEDGVILFNPPNCDDLKPEGLKYYFNKFIQINIRRQEMLKMAQGSIKKLACMVGVDWSEIRNYKDNIFLSHLHEEDMQKMERFYDGL